MRGDGSVAGEGRVVGVPKFHSWGKYTMSLTNINSDRMSNASSGLCIILVILYYAGPWSVIIYIIRESVLYVGMAPTRIYMQYLSKSRITSPQTRLKLI